MSRELGESGGVSPHSGVGEHYSAVGIRDRYVGAGSLLAADGHASGKRCQAEHGASIAENTLDGAATHHATARRAK